MLSHRCSAGRGENHLDRRSKAGDFFRWKTNWDSTMFIRCYVCHEKKDPSPHLGHMSQDSCRSLSQTRIAVRKTQGRVLTELVTRDPRVLKNPFSRRSLRAPFNASLHQPARIHSHIALTYPVSAPFTIPSLLFQTSAGELEPCRNTGFTPRLARRVQNKPDSPI